MDTSVWSLALRKDGLSDHPTVHALASALLANEDVYLLGVIFQELLQAFRHEAVFRKVVRTFEPFVLLPFARDDYTAAARLHRTCAAKGIAASTIDCQIATAAMRHDCQLLSADEDFRHIAGVSDLKLA